MTGETAVGRERGQVTGRNALAALTLVAASSASAQTGGSEYSNQAIRALTHDYARCVVTRHTAAASKALLDNGGNRTIQLRYQKLIDERKVEAFS